MILNSTALKLANWLLKCPLRWSQAWARPKAGILANIVLGQAFFCAFYLLLALLQAQTKVVYWTMIGFRIIFIAGVSYLISLRLALEYWVSNLECIMFQSTGLVFTQLHHLSWRADFEQPMTHRSSGTFPKQCLQDCSRSCLVKGLAQDGTHLVPESHQVWLTRCLDAFYLCWCFSRKRLVCKRDWTVDRLWP